MLTVSEIAHVAIMVSDVERTLDFYVKKLGFDEVMRLDRNGALWLVYLRVTDTQFIEVFHGGTGDRAPAFEAIGYNHLCLSVPDIERSVVELEQAGIPLYREKKFGLDGNWQCWIEDPDGHRIEIMQMMPDGMQMTAIARRSKDA